MIEKRAEFDVIIAGDAGIRGLTLPVGVHKIVDDLRPKGLRLLEYFMADADTLSDRLGIEGIPHRAAQAAAG